MNNKSMIYLEDGFYFQESVNTAIQKSDIHYHNIYEIYYLTSGSGRYFIDKKSYHLSAGHIALIPAGVLHKVNYDSSSRSRIVINCSENYIPKSVLEIFSDIPHFIPNDKNISRVKAIFDAIQKEYSLPDRFSDDTIKAKIYELLLLIAKEYSSLENVKKESSIIEKAIKYIWLHYAEDISLALTAKHCFVSPEHLSRTFKKETGFGFCEYVNILRLKKAEQLLKDNSKITVTEVSEKCGFNDSNYFSVRFKKMFGVSPKKIQKKSKN